LSGRNRRLLEGIFLEEKDRNQLCEELGVSAAHLRLLLHRAKKQFLDEYNEVKRRKRK
jgi:RNA polymerase sigma-70 factor (ECF subfamily)